ncbi:hypothetical protein [Evansella clarkii]|uniref:hypothetical protein n=1 Tax=Evansella clarkii TaxID=79879 RepID=UPI000998613E|nr:hypothetical protein [Evansella clarkii]
MSEEKNGVIIGPKEIYDELRGLSKSLTKLDGRMEKLEEKFEEKFEAAHEANERSREALGLAEDNERDILQLKEQFKTYKKQEDKRRDQLTRNLIGIVAIIIPLILAISPILISYYSP